VFGNREKMLPPRRRGYYREYTVPTPGARDRGARRIVAGAGPRATRAAQASTITATTITIPSGGSVSNPLEQLLKDKDKARRLPERGPTRGSSPRPRRQPASRCGAWTSRHVHDKQGFTGVVAKALAFPELVRRGQLGRIRDCLGDLSWHPAAGYVLLLEHGKHFACRPQAGVRHRG